MPTRINPVTGKVEEISDEDAAILYSGPVGPTRLAASLTPGALPPLPARGRSIWEQLDEAHAPVVERNIVGEAAAGLARGLGPSALETTGQALRGLGAEQAGTVVKGYGETLRLAAPRLFRPSTAAQVPGSFRNIVSSAFESIGQSTALSVPAIAATVASGGGTLPIALAYILSTPGVFGAAEYQNFFDEGRKAGIPDDVLRAPAFLSALSEVGFEAAGNVADVMLLGKGFSRLASKGMISKFRQGIKAGMTPRLMQTAAEVAASGAAEGGTEYLTAVAQNKLREGVGIEGRDDPFTAGAAGALAGALFGVTGKGIMRGLRRGQLNTLASAEAPQEARLNQVSQVVERMREGNVDDEAITQFSNYAADAIAQGQPIPLGEDITGLAPGPWQGPPSPMQGPPAPMQGPPSPTPLSPMPTVEEPLSPIEQPPSLLAPPPAQVSSFLAGETQAAREATTQPALTAAPEISDAALQIVLDAETRGFQGFNYQQEAAQLSQNYQIPLQQGQRVLSEAISAGRQDVQQTAPIVQPVAISEPVVEPAPEIQPPVPLTQPRGPQLPSGTAARLAAPRPGVAPAPAAPITGNRTEDLRQIGEMARGMGEALRDRLWADVQKGVTTEAGQPSALLQMAQQIRQQGGLQSREAFVRFAEKAQGVIDQYRGTPEYQAQLQQLVAQEVPTPAPPTSHRAPQLPPGITGRLAVQPEIQQELPPAGEAVAEGVPPTSAPTPETPQGQPTSPEAAAPPPPPEQFQASPQTQAQGGGEPWTLTRQEVDASFPSPGYRVLEIPEGGYRISTQAGYVDLNEVDQIQMGSEQRIAFQMGYGTPYSDDVSAAGRFVNEHGQARIELVKGAADRVTLLHEVEHWLEHSGQLTMEQIQQLSEATGKDEPTAEDRAEFVGRSLNDRRYRRDTAVGRILDQIWDYLDRLLALVGIRTTRGILRSIETGQMSQPDNGAVIDTDQAQQFQATRPTKPTLEQAPTENKLFTEYQSFLNYANPTVELLFRTNKANYLKQRVSLGQMSAEADAIIQYWADHQGTMTRVIQQWLTHQQMPRRDEMLALRYVGESYSDVLMAGVSAGTLTNEAFIQEKDQLTGPNSIFSINAGISSEWGRIGRMMQEYTKDQRFMQLMVQKQERIGRILTPEERAAYEVEFNRVAMMGDAAELDKFFGKVKAENPTVWDYLKEFWYGSVLSGFPTWIANPGGNTLWTTFSLGALRPVEAFLDPWIAKQQNRPQQYFMSEVLPSLMGYGRGLAQKERWKALGPGLKTGDFEMPGAAGISKMENEMEMFSSHWQHAKWQLDFPLMRKLGFDVGPLRRKLKDSFGIEPGQPINFMRTVAPIVSLGTRVMIGMDHLGRAAAYDGIIQGLVERQVEQELRAGDLTPDQTTARKAALLQQAHDGDNPAGEPMRKTAALQAKEFTFQDEKSAIANFILKGRTLPIIGRPFHLLFPFVATADRLIYRALELTPIAGMILHHDELTNWRTAGPAVTSILARQMTGVFISLVMLELFRQGVLTGDIPDDPGEREAFLRAGKQPRSFKVGDYYISYQRFEPLNLMLGWLPSMVQAAQRALERDDQAGALSIIGTMGAISVKHIIEGSYFSGFNSFLTGLNRPGGDQTEAFLSRMVDSWVPFSGARRSITRAWDAYQTGEGAIVRDPQGFLQYISGASLVSDVRPRYNVFGQPIVTPGNIAAQFLPYRISIANRDVVENELARYQIFPGPPSQQDSKGQKLDPNAYEFLVRTGGQAIKSKLDHLVQQAYYQRLNDDLKELYLRRAIKQGRDEARSALEQRQRAQRIAAPGR